MPDLTAKRTLVKSPPELWEELSAIEGLTKHFGAFGEIKITKLEPEHTVAWEGEHASGTVSIEPSGWGTKVTLHAELPEGAEAPEAEPETTAPMTVEPEPVEPEPVEAEPVEPEPVEAEPVSVEPDPEPEGVAEPQPVASEPDPKPAGVAEPEPQAAVEEAPKRRGFLAWLFRTRTAEQLSLAVELEPKPGLPSDPDDPRDPTEMLRAEGAFVNGKPDPVRELSSDDLQALIEQ